ncbi:hypothetical protein GBW32_13780 [Streptomyces tsukubensis]|nr:hypothetical protein GBW32_13780 [Streptomyces tsukubensis]
MIGRHHESGTGGRNNSPGSQRPRYVFFKGTTNLPKQAGVSTYLALTFGTLLSSQGTDASFVLTLSGFPPGASLRYFVFPTLPDPFSVPFPVRICFQWPLEGLCLSA